MSLDDLEKKYHRWVPVAVLLATMVVTAIVTWQFWRTLEAKDWAQFQNHIVHIQGSINDLLENTITLLRGGAGLFAASEDVTRAEFHAYMERLNLRKRYPGVQGIGWSRRVPASQKDELIHAMRTEGVEGFRIWPEHERAEYHTILYLEPFDQRNQAAIGYDMFSESVRRAAMERARDQGAAASGKVTLVQEIDESKQAGFLIYVPVYQNGRIPDTVEERRAKLLGFIYSPLRASDWLSKILESEPEPPVSFEIFDGLEADPNALLYRSGRRPADVSYRPRFSTKTTVSLAGRPWTLVFASQPTFNHLSDRYLVPSVFLSGTLISLLLASVTWVQTKARQEADESAVQLRRSQQELQASAKALQSSQERLHLALEAAHMAVWEWDILTGRIQESAEMGPLFGRSPEQIHANYQAFLEDIHPEDRERVERILKQAIADCITYDAEFRPLWPDGSVHWLAARGKVICDKTQRAVSTIGVALDITQRKRAEEALQEADRRKNIFLATLAHELRNPLAAISNSLHIMKLAGASGQSLEKSRAMAERQLNQLVRLVDDLLDISRIIQGKIRLQKERVELAAILKNAVEASRSLIAAAGHELTVTLPPGPLYLEVDATRIAQVVTNLLNNAAKYTQENGHIWLTAEREKNKAVVRVRDNGIGIAAAMLPRIFNMFMQIDNAPGRTQDGIGIGLTLVKSLVQLHQGSIEAHSTGPGQGSEFILWLPLAEQGESKGPLGGKKDDQRKAQACRILVVDDNEDSAESTTLLLRLLGHEVQLAHDGPAALAMLEAFKPDVTLLDIGLPGMDGYAVAGHMRRRFPNVMLVAMTGWGSANDRRRSEEAGFDHHLVKPIDLNMLNAVLAGMSPRP